MILKVEKPGAPARSPSGTMRQDEAALRPVLVLSYRPESRSELHGSTSMSNELADRQCEACRPGSSQVADAERANLLAALSNWSIERVDGMDQLAAVYRFADFANALAFVGRIGELAETENHHPQLVLEWGRVEVRWWTHSIGGLHLNDFIMAARSDRVFAAGS